MAGEQGELVRIATAGSVDDGKSTLIGRMLFDSKAILADQLDAVAAASRRRQGHDGDIDLSLLTDGLRAEREQGITIDVAYRYFATPRRTFIIADTPGHARYTRNMVTGASTPDLAVLLLDARSARNMVPGPSAADRAVILLDARTGLVEQTRRPAAIAATLGIPRVVLA